MRALIILSLVSLSGCSVMSSILGPPSGRPGSTFGTTGQNDPTKVYLGRNTVLIASSEANHYACASGPLYCEHFGVKMECRCSF